MNLQEWITRNDDLVDWSLFDEAWESMQLRHNPFQKEQIDAILSASRILTKANGAVLDLGCGPGTLGRPILNQRPRFHYVGADGDPLLVAALGHLVRGSHVQARVADLRSTEWMPGLAQQFDAVVSLAALHRLSAVQQQALYKGVFTILKPGGTFMIGDSYQPEVPEEQEEIDLSQELLKQQESGLTWEDFWRGFFFKYPIRQLYEDYHRENGNPQPFEQAEDGFPLSFELKALREAGFGKPTIFWKKGPRAVYGGMKYDS